jgi:hypothetical protein
MTEFGLEIVLFFLKSAILVKLAIFGENRHFSEKIDPKM